MGLKMRTPEIDLSQKLTATRIVDFATYLKDLSRRVGFKMSSRGWAYALEQEGLVTKAQFDKVESAVNRCRKLGHVPIDFVAEESGRAFTGVEVPDTAELWVYFHANLTGLLELSDYYTPAWWEGESWYVQVIVEKIDLKSLFEPVCAEYHIPIATSKGWSSMLQRAEYARRFRQAEARGLKCLLLYAGDHDPDGLRISDTLRKNLRDLSAVRWSDGGCGYDPEALTIERFGLNRDLIDELGLTWIDNLITGSGKNLDSATHPNHFMPYVQRYLEEHGARKCEANALVINPTAGRKLIRETIERWIGTNALERFQGRKDAFDLRFEEYRVRLGLDEAVESALEMIDDDRREGEDE